VAPNAQSQDPEARDLARLPELRRYRRRLQDPSMHLRISPTTCLLVLSADKRTLCDAPSTANWKSAGSTTASTSPAFTETELLILLRRSCP
jgi:hypothetical protein